jgi:hypothetical protein
MNFAWDSTLFEDSDAATSSLPMCVRVADLALETGIVGDISHSSIAGSGTVEDIPNARIVTPTGLEEVSSMFDLI